MFSRQINRRVHDVRSSRCMATLIATEEFASTPAVISNMRPAPLVAESTLASGAKIVSRDTGAPLTTFKFAVRGGSRNEAFSEKGAAHMLSIAAFGGTQNVSGLRLIRDLENIGAVISSSSDRERIVYEVTVPTEKSEDAVARVGEAICTPPAAAYVINDLKHRGQIDYDNLKNSPQLQLKEMLHEAAFGEDTPLGASIYNYNLNKLSADDIMQYRMHNYNAHNVTVTAVGGVSHDQLKQMVECYMASLPGGEEYPTHPMPASPYVGGDVRVRKDCDGTTYLALAFPVPAGLAAKPYQVLHNIIVSKVASMALRESALVPFYYMYSTGGIFGFYATGDSTEATDLLMAAVLELKSTASGNVDIEASKAKALLEAQLILDGEDPADALLLASMCGASAKDMGDLRTVNKADVKAAAIATLKAIPAYAVLGRTAGTLSFGAISKAITI